MSPSVTAIREPITPTPHNQRKTPGTQGVKLNADEEDAIRLICPAVYRQFVLYDSPSKVALQSKALEITEARLVELIERHKEKQARHTTQLYGPNHPQSWENLYSPAIKMLREMGIAK
jgi:hypothetical protein